MSTTITHTVTDLKGVRYELAEVLGRGGQGAVYAVKGGRLAVKIIEGGNQDRRDRLCNQLMHVRRLPLDKLPLARPLETLRAPHIGYVMELLKDMVPLKTLLGPPKRQRPSSEWYISSGGLQRRLLILGRTAQVLALLHGKGLAYSDPSPENIFISSNPEGYEVRLIDADNLQYESVKAAGVITPGYGAPELVSGRSGISTLSDVYAFAVLAFQTLSLTHPFIGDLVNDGDPELEEQAFAGNLPWIDDPEDTRNRASYGIQRENVLSKRLKELFALVFGPGRTDPTSRPGASEWADRLFAAADATIQCNHCQGTFYFNSATCPWCGTPTSSFMIMELKLWNPDFKANGGILIKPGDKPVILGQAVIGVGQTYTITSRLAFDYSVSEKFAPVVSVRLEGDLVKIRSLDGNPYSITDHTGKISSDINDHETSLKLGKAHGTWFLHFGKMDALHRVVSFDLREGKTA